MYIQPFRNRVGGDDPIDRALADLRQLLNQPTDREQRPCADCDTPCACSKHSTSCCCRCSPECPNAPQQLSSDPIRFPIEPLVVPLVYGLTTLRVVETCWSCEGHPALGGQPMKLPQVWFNSGSSMAPDLIARQLLDLRARRQLSIPWEIKINPYNAGGGGTTYIIKPDLAAANDPPDLPRLQADIRIIAHALQANIQNLAAVELRDLNRSRSHRTG